MTYLGCSSFFATSGSAFGFFLDEDDSAAESVDGVPVATFAWTFAANFAAFSALFAAFLARCGVSIVFAGRERDCTLPAVFVRVASAAAGISGVAAVLSAMKSGCCICNSRSEDDGRREGCRLSSRVTAHFRMHASETRVTLPAWKSKSQRKLFVHFHQANGSKPLWIYVKYDISTDAWPYRYDVAVQTDVSTTVGCRTPRA